MKFEIMIIRGQMCSKRKEKGIKYNNDCRNKYARVWLLRLLLDQLIDHLFVSPVIFPGEETSCDTWDNRANSHRES